MMTSAFLFLLAAFPLTLAVDCSTSGEAHCATKEDTTVMFQSHVRVQSPIPIVDPTAQLSAAHAPDANKSAREEDHSAPVNAGGGESSETKDDDHGTLGSADEAHEGHGYLVLVFLFGCLTIGACVTMLQKRYLKSIPYTVLLFVAGLLLAVIHHYKPRYHWMTWQAWYMSVDQWQSISPHLLFYVFLPVLVFGDAFKMNGHLVKHMLSRILLLAGPGVVLGTFLTGVFTYYVLPWGWDWPFSLLLGSILSATDPVAVVALFNSLGVSAELTMLVSGESLLNDGTAVVAFGLLLNMVKGEAVTMLGSMYYFLNMTVVAYLLGFLVASLAVLGICVCSRGDSESDPFIQVVITICCAFVCFILAEHEFGTSGILTLVTAGVVLSKTVWPMFVSQEVIKCVWETIEFVANTVIFVLAGLLLGGECLSNRNHIGLADVGYLFAFYAALTLIRGLMVCIFWWPLKLMGTELSRGEMTVMVWAGLRGAIGLVMAIIVDADPAISQEKGAKVIFYVGGMAALTLLVNAVTCGPLLQYLGMLAESDVVVRKKQHYQSQMRSYADDLLRTQQIGKDTRFQGVEAEIVKRMLATEGHGHEGHTTEAKEGQVQAGFYREMLLQAVKQNYWEDVNTEIIPKSSTVAQTLLASADECLIHAHNKPLDDWAIVERSTQQSLWFPGMGSLLRRAFAWFPDMLETFPSAEMLKLQKVYAALCFQEAHRKAQETIREQSFLADEDTIASVMRESEEQQQKAAQFLSLVAEEDPKALEYGKAKMLARYLLHAQKSKIRGLADLGMLTEREVEDFTHIFNGVQSSLMSDCGPEAKGVESSLMSDRAPEPTGQDAS